MTLQTYFTLTVVVVITDVRRLRTLYGQRKKSTRLVLDPRRDSRTLKDIGDMPLV